VVSGETIVFLKLKFLIPYHMKTTLTLILFLGLFAFFPNLSKAQSIGDAFIVNAAPQGGYTQSVLNIVLTDTVNVSSIIVKVGSLDGSQDLFSYTFTFDQSGGFSNGVGYSRSGYKVSCPLGNLVETAVYFTEVTSVNSSGALSPAFKFVSN
jgi:hypothetical protein